MDLEDFLYLDITTIDAADTGLLHDAPPAFDGIGDSIIGHLDRIRGEVIDPLTDAWTGIAQNTAMLRLNIIMEGCKTIASRMDEVASAVRSSRTVTGFAGEFTNAQRALAIYRDEAATNGLFINGDGSVDYLGRTDQNPFLAAALKEDLEDKLGNLRMRVMASDIACAEKFDPPSEDDGDSAWDWIGRLGNFSSVTSILGKTYKGAGVITGITGAIGIYQSWEGIFEAEGGLGKSAQIGKTAFNAACIATVLQPELFPLVLATAAWWGGSNLLDKHWHTIREGWDDTWEFGSDVAGEARNAWDEGWERGGDLLGGLL